MMLMNKSIDESKNKCVVCSKSLQLNDIIIIKSLLCYNCYGIISNVNIDDLEYEFYKNKIKKWLLEKYKFDDMR